MKNKLLLGVLMAAALFVFASCSGGSGGAGGSVASVGSLSSLPSVDLSQYDKSTVASASLSSGQSVGKGLGGNLTAVGGNSRAGCEANMHKQEVFRMSQTVQLDRCYPEAMEKAGFITIPTDSYAFYKIVPPAQDAEQKMKKCEGIPVEMEDEKTACEAGEGPSSGNMLMRLGRFDNELRIDMCQGASGSEALVDEATFTASGSQYGATITRSGTWGGKPEGSKFVMTVDLGASGSVTDGLVNLGTDGTISATGEMDGSFGNGTIIFEGLAADVSNKVKGAFSGSFVDPFTSTQTTFEGKVYSHFTNKGCAKFSFTGSMPPMRVVDMIPFDIPTAQLEVFLQTFGAELGIDINAQNYATMNLCPNPAFVAGESDSNLVKPMLPATGACPPVTNTGVECFAITNGTVVGNFGSTFAQTFTIIAPSQSSFYDEVNAFDLSVLTPFAGTVAFTRSWNCQPEGAFTNIDFGSFTEAQMLAAQAAMAPCQALEEKARGNEGMGGYNCGEEQQMNGVQEMKETGASFGVYGGELTRIVPDAPDENNNCDTSVPSKLFINFNANTNTYCIPNSGGCSAFTVDVGTNVANPEPDIDFSGLATIKQIFFTKNGDTANTARLYLVEQDSCKAKYSIFQPGFNAIGTPGQLPAACSSAGITTPDQCQQFCMQPGSNCAPPQ